ncbi:unnamed protein product [Staurois parvus]|uniref:Secreted protein n=1 Tax=Staurois parvus TaxID=386267 RepID=A0ABN9G805_9NEOB|nr:unnamed protein product [Staurois parvus]
MYVKCFDTVMFYYVILVYFVNVTFSNFLISRRSIPIRRREWNPEDGCRHRPKDIAKDTAGGTSWERRTR